MVNVAGSNSSQLFRNKVPITLHILYSLPKETKDTVSIILIVSPRLLRIGQVFSYYNARPCRKLDVYRQGVLGSYQRQKWSLNQERTKHRVYFRHTP